MLALVTFGQQQAKYGADQPNPEPECLISPQHLQQLEELALEKVRASAGQDSLLQAPKLPIILYCWRDWKGENEVKQYVAEVTSNFDEGLIVFLEKFLQKTFSYSTSDGVLTEHYKLNLKQLEPFLDPAQIIDRIRIAEESNLTENQKIAISQFIQEYKMISEQTDTSINYQ